MATEQPDRRTRLQQLARLSVMTDSQLAEILPTLTPFERLEVLIAKYVSGISSRANDGHTPAPQADAQVGYHLARKIRPWLGLSKRRCDCITSGNQAKPKQHGADPHAKNCAVYQQGWT